MEFSKRYTSDRLTTIPGSCIVVNLLKEVGVCYIHALVYLLLNSMQSLC